MRKRESKVPFHERLLASRREVLEQGFTQHGLRKLEKSGVVRVVVINGKPMFDVSSILEVIKNGDGSTVFDAKPARQARAAKRAATAESAAA